MPKSRKKVKISAEKEKAIQRKMVMKLKEENPDMFIKEEVEFDVPDKLKKTRKSYYPDIVGLDRNGQVSIVECKKGKFITPSAGLGKLLLYRLLIRDDFPLFKEQLKEYFDKEVVDRVNENNIKYILALSEGDDEARVEFLKELVNGTRPKVELCFV